MLTGLNIHHRPLFINEFHRTTKFSGEIVKWGLQDKCGFHSSFMAPGCCAGSTSVIDEQSSMAEMGGGDKKHLLEKRDNQLYFIFITT